MGVDLKQREINSEIKFNNYLLVVRTLSKDSAYIDVVDLSTNKFYQIENYVFSQSVSVKTLITGLQRKSQEIQANITRIEDKEKGNKLKISVSVIIQYLPQLEETILLENKPISICDLLEIKLKIAKNEIETLKKSLEVTKPYKKYVYQLFYKRTFLKDEECANFTLPKVNGKDILLTKKEAFSLNGNDKSGNIIFNFNWIGDCNEEVNSVSMKSLHVSDYQWDMSNLIISADTLPS